MGQLLQRYILARLVNESSKEKMLMMVKIQPLFHFKPNASKGHLLHMSWSLRVVQDDLLHLWPEFEIDYTPMFNIPYTYLPPDLKVTVELT